jgi:hypothetical protein
MILGLINNAVSTAEVTYSVKWGRMFMNGEQEIIS